MDLIYKVGEKCARCRFVFFNGVDSFFFFFFFLVVQWYGRTAVCKIIGNIYSLRFLNTVMLINNPVKAILSFSDKRLSEGKIDR